eukprot:m.140795 g.140795  ORF g.140795 m.140795 type:complete len:450 (-) comp17094_c1_seq1:30-1379(-)
MVATVTKAYALMAMLMAVSAASGNTPTQIHLALGDTSGRYMVASWITEENEDSMVLYGKNPSYLDKRATGTEPATRYTFTSQFTGSYTSGLIHHVKFGPLSPATKYYYQVADGTASGVSAQFSFTTPPEVGPETPFVLGVIGDLGQTANSSLTRDRLIDDETITLTLLAGDLSYADSAWDPVALKRNCTQKRWDSWGEFVQPLAANQPIMVLPGNHEVEQQGPPPATQEQFLAFQKRFRMPSEECGATAGNLYYSLDVASAHIIMLNSYMPFNSSSDQFAWVKQDLEKVDRSKTPWLFVLMHAPWYNSNQHHHNEPEEVDMRSDMEDLLFEHHVDAIFSGHVHAYERTVPVFRNVSRPDAPTYVVVGDAGNREGPATGYFPKPDWSVYREAVFGHGRLELYNSTHAHWAWHRAADSVKTIGDDVWFVKNSFVPSRGLTHGVVTLPFNRR